MKKIHYLFYFCLLFSCKHDVLNKKETPFDDLEKLEESGNIASLSNVKISNDFENLLMGIATTILRAMTFQVALLVVKRMLHN